MLSGWRWGVFRFEHPFPQKYQERGNADILTKLTVSAHCSRRLFLFAYSRVKAGSREDG